MDLFTWRARTGGLARVLTVAGLMVLGAMVTACGRSTGALQPQRYDLIGTVGSVDKSRNELTLAHDAIPGFMPGMTIPCSVKDGWVLVSFGFGDRVSADIVVIS